MADTNTTILDLVKFEDGSRDNTWGADFGLELDKIDTAIAGRAVTTTTGGTVTLNKAQARARFQLVNGTLASNSTIEVPAVASWWIVSNETAGAFTVTVRPAGGTGAVVQAGRRALVLSTGSTCSVVAVPTAAADLSALSKIAADATNSTLHVGLSGTGALGLQPHATLPGYIEFLSPSYTRRGYIGLSDGNNRLYLFAESGWSWRVNSALLIDGALTASNALNVTGTATVTGSVVATGTITVGSGATSSTIVMADTDDGNRSVQNAGGLIGFFGSSGSWALNVNDAGELTTPSLGTATGLRWTERCRFSGNSVITVPTGGTFPSTSPSVVTGIRYDPLGVLEYVVQTLQAKINGSWFNFEVA